jgi:hypothetical protein
VNLEAGINQERARVNVLGMTQWHGTLGAVLLEPIRVADSDWEQVDVRTRPAGNAAKRDKTGGRPENRQGEIGLRKANLKCRAMPHNCLLLKKNTFQ